jgi:hypothetical protein
MYLQSAADNEIKGSTSKYNEQHAFVILGFRRGINEIFAFWTFMQRREVATKVSGQSLGTIFKDQAVQD